MRLTRLTLVVYPEGGGGEEDEIDVMIRVSRSNFFFGMVSIDR